MRELERLEVIRFRSYGGPYKCSLPDDQSGEYYRKADVDAEVGRLRADVTMLRNDRKEWIRLAEQLQAAIDEARKG